jgi:cytochrome P450
MGKYDEFYRFFGYRNAASIVSASCEHHSFLRRQLAHGFSERSMRLQEPLLDEYTNALISKLMDYSDNCRSLDLRSWYNYTTFDVIGNLSFGSDFGCLSNSGYHPWVAAINDNLRENALLRAAAEIMPGD